MRRYSIIDGAMVEDDEGKWCRYRDAGPIIVIGSGTESEALKLAIREFAPGLIVENLEDLQEAKRAQEEMTLQQLALTPDDLCIDLGQPLHDEKKNTPSKEYRSKHDRRKQK